MGNNDSKSIPAEKATPHPDSSESEDEASDTVFPSDPDIMEDTEDSDERGLNEEK